MSGDEPDIQAIEIAGSPAGISEVWDSDGAASGRHVDLNATRRGGCAAGINDAKKVQPATEGRINADKVTFGGRRVIVIDSLRRSSSSHNRLSAFPGAQPDSGSSFLKTRSNLEL